MKIECFTRNEKDQLIPVKETIDTRSSVLKTHLLVQQNKLKNYSGKSKVKKLALKAAVAELKKEYESSGGFEEILILPVMNFEFDNLGSGLGIDGEKAEDVNATVLAKKCIEPSFTYETARDMKDRKIKQLIIDKILSISVPKLNEKALKKVAAILEKTK
jgi:hypothetical protein